jgi:ribonuclease Z
MQLTVLGTAAQMPTARRNHNAYFLKWGKNGFLIDPGESVQRQMIFAGIRPSAITHILISHFHGDHCFGLPGLLQKIAAANPRSPIPIIYPAEGEAIFRHLLGAAALENDEFIRPIPVSAEPFSLETESFFLESAFLDHRIQTLGFRIEKISQWRIDTEKIAQISLPGPLIGKLKREEKVEYNGKSYHLSDYASRSQPIAFSAILDTRPCPTAAKLLHNAALALLECTYLPGEASLARQYKHLTVTEARQLCENNLVNAAVLTHFSQRYVNTSAFEAYLNDSSCQFILADDLDQITLNLKTKELNRQKPAQEYNETMG